MNTLPQKEQHKIRNITDMRLLSWLSRSGVDFDEVEGMDRPRMIDAWAEIVASGGDKMSAAVGGAIQRKLF